MQFHLDGYTHGDPRIQAPHPAAVRRRSEELPTTCDVLIVGCGPAGLVLAAALANVPELHTVIVDRRDGPLEVGQADGVACRTVEMFATFGLSDQLIAEGYQVNEVTFWHPDPADATRIVRTGRIADVEDDLSEMPHMIVNQARMQAYLSEHVARSASRAAPFYGLHAADVQVTGDGEYPVSVTLEHQRDRTPTGELSTVQARYVVGCDGSRSSVRAAIGRHLEGDTDHQSWGVMDVLATTDFPDIRLKSAIHSTAGSILIIPREGGYLVRLYIELDNERDSHILRERRADPEALTAAANRILAPYSLDVRHVGWAAVYEIGQRLCDRFDDVPAELEDEADPRVFIAGDACHTHSAKAGQGMNVSMADAWNLAWKLAAVLRGRSTPALLHTYTAERQVVAQELIDFDREFAGKFSSRDADGSGFQEYFREQGRFTAGVAVRYRPSMITAATAHQHLATGLPVGMRFHSAPVVRLADAKPMQLGHVARADGAWRLYAFADAAGSAMSAFCASVGPVLARYTPRDVEPDAVLDLRAIYPHHHRQVAVETLPPVLRPAKGPFGLTDHEKVFCGTDVYEMRGIDREHGCLVVVRPDQYVAHVLPLDAHDELDAFLAGVLLPAQAT